MPRSVLLFALCFAFDSAVFAPTITTAAETDPREDVTFKVGQQQRTVKAKIMVEAQDGGLMLCADDGHIWMVQPEQLVKREPTGMPLVPVTDTEMSKRLLKELGGGFAIYRTQHYVVAYNSNEAYARQVAAMFEQLYKGFFTYWKNQDWDLPEPEYPLVAVVLKDRSSFLRYAEKDIGETARDLIGYYHLSSNRMITFNIPNFERNVSTIIHEATHQLAYNCGLQKRFSDNPMWVSEGIATYFETPDRRNPTKWRNIGRVNQVNLNRWRKYLRNRGGDSLVSLVAEDNRFRSAASAEAAYGEAWALTYFLIRTRRSQYVDYLKELSTGRPLAARSPKERVQLFEEKFETTMSDIDSELVTYMRRVR